MANPVGEESAQGFIQDGPVLGNQYRDDRVLRASLRQQYNDWRQ